MTRRSRLQATERGVAEALEQRAVLPVRMLSIVALISSAMIACSSRSLRAKPNT